MGKWWIRISYKCLNCNKAFTDQPHKKRKFCTNICSNKYKKYRILPDSFNEKIGGKNHYAWKGDNASYRSLHRRVEKNRGKANRCEICGLDSPSSPKRYQWANLTGKYADINDYKQMCASCHRKYDLGRAKSKLS